jgi:hypothetical protein
MRSFRLLVAVLVTLGVSTPAGAQFKKLKDAVKKSADPQPEAAAPAAPGQAARADNSVVVVTPEVVDRLLAGRKAAEAEREKAAKEDTPYGRFMRAKDAYTEGKAKCTKAQMKWGQRPGDDKLVDRYSALVDKALAAQQKGDMVEYQNKMYEALGLIDPSCAVRDPQQPENFYDMQRAVDERANKARKEATGLTDRELGLTDDRVFAILNKTEPPGGASASEKSAIKARESELKSLYGIRDPEVERAAKPAPAPEPAAATVNAQPSAGAPAVNECMMKNIQAHEDEIRALGDRGSAAQEAGNTTLMMAIADTIMRIQSAGCNT